MTVYELLGKAFEATRRVYKLHDTETLHLQQTADLANTSYMTDGFAKLTRDASDARSTVLTQICRNVSNFINIGTIQAVGSLNTY